MKLQPHYALKSHNSLAIDAQCACFVTVRHVDDILQLTKTREFKHLPRLIMGGGSNILFSQDFTGLIIHNALQGIETVQKNRDHIWLKVAAGMNWHKLVRYCVHQGYGGLENLSLIPGCVGATPVQNIGAYGVELKEVLSELSAFNLYTNNIEQFSLADCEFGYRDSIFKHSAKGNYLILSVTLKLARQPEFQLSYDTLQQTVDEMMDEMPQDKAALSLQLISDAIIKIRQNKLPDPATLPNAGSFFKNPCINKADFLRLKQHHPELPSFPFTSQQLKIPAAWLIEQCQWKGKRLGDAGVHDRQALVLVNHGNASGAEILTLAEKIRADVQAKFAITLETEVTVI